MSAHSTTFHNPTKFQSQEAPPSQLSPIKSQRNSLSNKVIGTICILAATVFALLAVLSLAATIFAATSGGGPAAAAIGAIAVTIFTGLTIATATMAIRYFGLI